MKPFSLLDFLLESNRIEGISGVRQDLIEAAERFLALCYTPTMADLCDFVKVAQPDAILRDKRGVNVSVGEHIAPAGGPDIPRRLGDLLFALDERRVDPYRIHVEYEMLHPYTDGNGRSGRILWLWAMGGIESVPLGFLHTFYYQTLSHAR